MSNASKIVQLACAALLGSAPAALAQQQSGMSNMGGMNMQTMMQHCAHMHQQMSAGKPISAKMHKMMAQCDQMDAQMQGGKMGGMKMNAPAPDATQSR